MTAGDTANTAPATLVEFYAARLDEDEAAAKEAAEDSGAEWSRNPEGLSGIVVAGGEIVVYDEGRPTEAEADHIARHDPVRVLREVAAKRAILAEYKESLQFPYDLPEGIADGRDDDERERDAYLIDVLDGVVRHLAAVYSGHPGYREEWKP
jgi:Family of unknown function (DUF6221)